MTEVQSHTVSLPNSGTVESTAKQLFKQAWSYSQRIELASRGTGHILDLYSPKLQDLRRKLREKCVEILLISCSYRRKAEELLWKKVFYDLIQKSKSNRQALDGSSPLYQVYSEHLSMATAFYTQLLPRLEDHYQLSVTSMDASQLKALHPNNVDGLWLGGAAYRCLLYLGDLARYRVDVGGKPYTAVTHYQHAISLDPTNGAPFNQLAALSGNKHEGLDAVYYYMRSISSPQPFPGAEVNLQYIFNKSSDRLETLIGDKERATDANIREVTRSLLLVRLVTLHHMLSSPHNKLAGSEEKSVPSLCKVLLSDIEECLTFDLQLFIDMCPSRVLDVVSSEERTMGGGRGGGESDARKAEELACLPSDLLLKVVTLCMLSSTNLREQGSSKTPAFTSFTLSIFSLLLRFSLLRLSHLTRHTLHTLTTPSCTHPSNCTPTAIDPEFSEENMVKVFLGRLKGEALDEYAQQTPGIARQLRVNSSKTVELSEEVASKLSIGPSITWGGEQVVCSTEKTNLSGVEMKGKEREGEREEGSGRDKSDIKVASKNEKKCDKKSIKKTKKKKQGKIVNRRRQHKRPIREPTPLSSDDEAESNQSDMSKSSDSGSTSDSSSEEEEEEEQIDRIDSLSDMSLSEEEKEEEGVGGLEDGVSPRPWTSSILRCGELSGEERGDATGKVEESGGKERGGGRGGGKKQIVLAANFGAQSNPSGSEGERKEGVAADDSLFQTLLLQTRHQAALHLSCSLAAEDCYLMPLKIFCDWLTEHPLVIAVCTQGSPDLWSRLASLLNFLPPAQEIIAAGLRTTLPPGVEWTQTHALYEDTLLHGFTPLIKTHQSLHFKTTAYPEILEQACNRICVLQKFGRHIARTKATTAFQWEVSEGRFLAPLQRGKEEAKAAAITQHQQEKKAAENRSKLMKAMAQRLLQSEVASLAETSAQQQAAVFTPYLLPDALTLCTALHLIRKLLSSEKFIVVIAKSVIDSLDGMKKGRENYAAREAIKFLERSLQGGGRMVRVQGDGETLQPGRRKPPKMELNTWRYCGLVDCALYFTHTYTERGSSSRAATTLLLDRSAVGLVEGGSSTDNPALADVLSEAQLNGIPIETAISFHTKWQQSQSTAHNQHTANRRR